MQERCGSLQCARVGASGRQLGIYGIIRLAKTDGLFLGFHSNCGAFMTRVGTPGRAFNPVQFEWAADVVRQIICLLVCRYFDPRKCWLLLATCDALVRPDFCQRATYTGTPHIGKNQHLENRRPHRAAPHVADCIGDSGFALKPCCTRLSVLWRGPVHRQAARDRRANSAAGQK